MTENGQKFFSEPTTEKLFESLVALAAEVYVLRERVLHLEAKIPVDGPAETKAFVDHVFGWLAAPCTRPDSNS